MKISPQKSPSTRSRAITLIECMVLMTIMSITVLGTGTALQSLTRVPTNNNRSLVIANLLLDKMEQLRALGFTTLSTSANSSDTVTIDNVTYTRSWTITSNPNSNYDANFIQVTVTIGSQSLTSGLTKP